jgi:hypothetical protein
VAAKTPTGSAISSATSCEVPITKSVTGRRCTISLSTSTRLENEKPQFPLAIDPAQRT